MGRDLLEPSAWDDEALREFVVAVLPAAFGAARGICTDHDDAHDAVMTGVAGFVGALRDGRVDPARRPRAYLLAGVRNAAIDVHRHRWREVPASAPVERRGPEEHVEALVEERAMATAFARLKPQHRQCLVSVDEHDGDMDAAGKAMRPIRNAAAMRSMKRRARKRLLVLYLEEIAGGDVGRECRVVIEALISASGLSAEHEAHLSSCVACAAAEDELTHHGLRPLAMLPVPAFMAAEVEALVQECGDAGAGGQAGARVGRPPVNVVAGCVAAMAATVAMVTGVSGVWTASEAEPRANGAQQLSDDADGETGSRPGESSTTPAEDEGATQGPTDTDPGESVGSAADSTPVDSAEQPIPVPAQPPPDGSAPVARDDPPEGDEVEAESLVSVVVGPAGPDQLEVSVPGIEELPLPQVAAVQALAGESTVSVELLGENLVGKPSR